MKPLRFTLEEAQAAADEWNFNCGPGALCAVLDMTPGELRPHLLDFEAKGYTNPTLMFDILKRLSVRHRLIHRADDHALTENKAELCLMRVQWAGPWTAPGVPMRVRYRHTHWVAVHQRDSEKNVFDVNAVCVGGWIDFPQWKFQLVPWLLKECVPKANGDWWATHIIEIIESATQA